jgi:hypothetical protein
MRRGAAVIVAGFAALTGCASPSAHPGHAASTTVGAQPATTASAGPTTPDRQVWLCQPDEPNDPCLTSLDSTAVGPNGTNTVADVTPARHPNIDCFYVYPTVSQQTTPNADLAIDPAEVGAAVAQAARYSQVCRVFAPIYCQGTLSSLSHRSASTTEIAFQSLRSAWQDYLARYNDGRGIVLIAIRKARSCYASS